MTAKDLFYGIGQVGDDLVEEAARDLPRRRRWVLPAACAACAVLVAAGVWLGSLGAREDTAEQPVDPNLPILTLGGEMWGGMGFEGVMAYDISEYSSGAPALAEEVPGTLPVFVNPTRDGVSQEEMEEKLASVLEGFGLDPALAETAQPNWQMHSKDPDGEKSLYGLSVSDNGMTIEVQYDMAIQVEFEPALALPEEYHGAEGSRTAAQALGEYLLREYPQWFSWMETPTVHVEHGDYDIYGGQYFELHVTDEGQDYGDALIGDAYRNMWLCISEEDGLWLIWVYWPDLSQVMGEYPIISADEARELLLDGSYASSVPYEVSGADAIRRVELCYRNDRTQIWIPYYRFWVEIPAYESQKELGLKHYGAYYVPAVEGRYIANMPTYDGSFN